MNRKMQEEKMLHDPGEVERRGEEREGSYKHHDARELELLFISEQTKNQSRGAHFL